MVTIAATAQTTVMRAAPSPVSTLVRPRVRPRVACGVGGPGLGDSQGQGHRGQVDDGNRDDQTEMLAHHHHGQGAEDDLPGEQRLPVPAHRRELACVEAGGRHLVLVHGVPAARVWVGLSACSSMTATRRSKTGSASVRIC
jgi:hypothetical protein